VYPNAFPKNRFGMEEIVGPVLSMIPVETLDDAIHLLESSCCGSAVNILSEHGGGHASSGCV
jgi:acyl-CoA reductase-like NAD-dependent aldehyde dehydrogenase